MSKFHFENQEHVLLGAKAPCLLPPPFSYLIVDCKKGLNHCQATKNKEITQVQAVSGLLIARGDFVLQHLYVWELVFWLVGAYKFIIENA
jgi:hypothetical protein